MTIEFRGVHASYDANTPILRGVDFVVEDGEFVAFVGTNGAGKSTTMRLVNGLLKPDSGQVLIDGVPTTQLKTSELARRVGFLFQNPDSQICCSTVREELLFGFRALGMDMSKAARRVDGVIAEFGFNADDDPFLLNRGTRQLLALASIVVLGTPIVVLDEPTTGLDFRECVKVMRIIRRLHEQGATVIMVCHDMEVVADFAERVIVMSDGRVVDQGPTFEVLRNRRTLEAANLVPPQIVDISLGLSIMRPDLAGGPVGRANTLNEMESAVAAAVGKAAQVADREDDASAPGAQDALGSESGAGIFEVLGDLGALSPAAAGLSESASDDSPEAFPDCDDEVDDEAPEPGMINVVGLAVPGTKIEYGRKAAHSRSSKTSGGESR